MLALSFLQQRPTFPTPPGLLRNTVLVCDGNLAALAVAAAKPVVATFLVGSHQRASAYRTAEALIV